MLRDVSTEDYEEVLPETAQTVGVSRSSVGREAVQTGAEQLKSLREKRWDTVEIGRSRPMPAALEPVIVYQPMEAGATENTAAVSNRRRH